MMKNSLVFVVCGMILITALAMTARTEEENLPPERTNQVIVNYVFPEKPAHQQIYELMKERHTLETLKEFFSPFRLRWPLYISLTGCDGEADAFYGDDTITICYEYLEELIKNMPTETTATGIEPLDTVFGPFMDTILHEFAHALFDYLDVPVLGREEDAADQVAAYTYLHLGKDEAHRLITGAVYAYWREMQDTNPPSMADFAGEHGTSEQRAFNLICMAYGADPELFKDLVKMRGLPDERAANCEEEYELVTLAYQALITPYIDPDLAEKNFNRSWLPENTSRMLHKDKLN
jgi:hypothetical protein